MSKTTDIKRLSITDIAKMKGDNPIVCLTAYSAPMAKLMDEQVDIIFVGDSLGMVLYGYESTLPVSLNMMVRHGKTVVENTNRACVLVDMPFGSYQASPAKAFDLAAKVIRETGCQCIKLEGGMEMVETVEFLSSRGIPVMAHIGLKPQHVQSMGGYKTQGKTDETAKTMLEEAKAFEDAGAFSLLIEGTAESVAREITESVSIPTIGIGASPACDGQVLVTEDMLGMFESTPKFVKVYGNLRNEISGAINAYAGDVRARSFPEEAHCFKPKT